MLKWIANKKIQQIIRIKKNNDKERENIVNDEKEMRNKIETRKMGKQMRKRNE